MKSSRSLRWVLAAIAVASMRVPAMAPAPLQAEADALQHQVEQAAQRRDMTAVLKAMDRYHALYQVIFPDPDADAIPLRVSRPGVPAPLWLAEAKAAFATGDAVRAARALEAFIARADADTSGYQEAQALRGQYARAGAKAKVARRKAAQAARPRLVRTIEQQMMAIPAGAYVMGDRSGVMHYRHKPDFTTMTVKAFRLSRYEITYEQYDQYADATGRERPREIVDGRGNLPVVNVSWRDAQGFIAWLNDRTGRKFRLPTEAEWEYAARAGSQTEYPWGDSFDAHLANGEGTAPGDRWLFTAPTGSFPPDAWGLYDMIGNVQEWTQDCYSDSLAGAPPDGSARSGSSDCRHVYRGGSWSWPSYYLYASARFEANTTGVGEVDVGIRLAEDAAR